MTVRSIEVTLEFYCETLGFSPIFFGEGRVAIDCGGQKINLHEVGKEIEPNADRSIPGSVDLCLLISSPIEEVMEVVDVIEGPVLREGAKGKIRSIYLRDPDLNLIELSNTVSEKESP